MAVISTYHSLLERLERRGGPIIDLGLERPLALMKAVGHPERHLPPVIHVAGTNGKGSLCAYLTAIGEAAGLRVHRYISPHLVHFNERIVLAGREIEDDRLTEMLARVVEPAERFGATFFEATTAAAFLAFAEVEADWQILETGLGGRLDATNVVASPMLTALTPISYDHQAFLGNTLEAIAGEKAGILKPGVPCVVGEQPMAVGHVIRTRARQIGSPIHATPEDWQWHGHVSSFSYRSQRWAMDGLQPALSGPHQLSNAALAVACIDRLADRFGITEAQMRQGLADAQWPARLQRLDAARLGWALPGNKTLWLDGGHNAAAGEALAQWASTLRGPIDLMWGMMGDKDAEGFLAPLRPFIRRVVCVPIPDAPLASPPETLAGIAGPEAMIASDAGNAVARLCDEYDASRDILIAGSLYLAGHVLSQQASVC